VGVVNAGRFPEGPQADPGIGSKLAYLGTKSVPQLRSTPARTGPRPLATSGNAVLHPASKHPDASLPVISVFVDSASTIRSAERCGGASNAFRRLAVDNSWLSVRPDTQTGPLPPNLSTGSRHEGARRRRCY
jgi:hypothetical protein